MMKTLIHVGYYRETVDDPGSRRGLPSLAEAVSRSPHEEEAKIVAYLRNGVCIGAIGRYFPDVLDPTCRLPILGHRYTDGTYLWPLYTAYYVERYHVRLPESFIEHMASMGWQPPARE